MPRRAARSQPKGRKTSFRDTKDRVDRLDELAVLVAVIDCGSLAAAGRRLHRSPPAMTRALAALEARAGVRLVERTTRALRPTEAGRALVGQARGLLAAYQEALQEPGASPLRGLLRIAAPLVFGRRHVSPLVASFLDRNPEVRIELHLDDRLVNLVGEGFDLALRIGRLDDSGLVAHRVGQVRRLLVAAPEYLARRPPPQTPADLARHDLVLSSQRPAEWRYRSRGRERIVRLVPRLLVNEVEAMLLAVRAGRGIGSPLSYQVAGDLAAGTMLRLLPEYEPAPLPVQLVVPGGRRPAPKVRAFLDWAVPALTALLRVHEEQLARTRGV